MESKDLILAFDTETSGLWPKHSNQDINAYPFIVQLSFIVYNKKQQSIVYEFNSYIKQNAEIDYESTAFKINKITEEMCNNGMSITNAIAEFHKYYLLCGSVIAHNLEFDKKMLQLEILRNNHVLEKQVEGVHVLFNDVFNDIFNIKTYCTMYMGKNITNITMTGKDGRQWKKSPKLIELYKKLFNDDTPQNLHDSKVDTLLCLKCFAKMKYEICM